VPSAGKKRALRPGRACSLGSLESTTSPRINSNEGKAHHRSGQKKRRDPFEASWNLKRGGPAPPPGGRTVSQRGRQSTRRCSLDPWRVTKRRAAFSPQQGERYAAALGFDTTGE